MKFFLTQLEIAWHLCAKGLVRLLFLSLSFYAVFLPQYSFAVLQAGTKITNTAQASFTVNNSPVMMSASADVMINGNTPSSITIGRVVSSPNIAGAVPSTLKTTQCQGISGAWTVLPNALLTNTNIPLESSVYSLAGATLRSGTPLLITVTDLDQNHNQNQVETVDVVVTSQSGDKELLRLTETGTSTGVFSGYIQTQKATVIPQDCVLEIATDDSVNVDYQDVSNSGDHSKTHTSVDPLSRVFDSKTGEGIAGAVVQIINNKTGELAVVYGDDGSTVISSKYTTTFTKGAGEAGFFRFPYIPAGEYRFVVIPPSGYHFPSTVSDVVLKQINGNPDAIGVATHGGVFTINSIDDIWVADIALDRRTGRLELTKAVSATNAAAGDMLSYQVSVRNTEAFAIGSINLQDKLPMGITLVKPQASIVTTNQATSSNTGGTNNNIVPVTIDKTGRNITIPLPALEANQSITIRYNTKVGIVTPMGIATNTAQAIGEGIESNIAEASVNITDDLMSTQAVLVGRVVDQCRASSREVPAVDRKTYSEQNQIHGIAGVRIQMEDGRYNISDAEGRWHIEKVNSGTHVVQLDRTSIPQGYRIKNCDYANAGQDDGLLQDLLSNQEVTQKVTASALNKGSVKRTDALTHPFVTSRTRQGDAQVVDVKAGTLWQVDFVLERDLNQPLAAPLIINSNKPVAKNAGTVVTGFDAAWLEQAPHGNAIEFPAEGFTPVTSAVGLAIRYQSSLVPKVTVNGVAISGLAYDGSQTNSAGSVSLATWRGVSLIEGLNKINVNLVDQTGVTVTTLTRDVYFSSIPEYAQVDLAHSTLLADGKSPIVLAIRLTDAFNKPLRAGMTGAIRLEGQYIAAELSNPSKRDPFTLTASQAELKYIVGDNGVALIPLKASALPGQITAKLQLANGRLETLNAWVDVAQREWMLVGLAEGTLTDKAFSNKITDVSGAPGVERVDNKGRAAFYAVGTVRGDTLLTIAYDTDKDKKSAQDNLSQALRSDEYYLVYADDSSSGQAAISSSKLYIRIDRRAFSAIYGDFNSDLAGGKLTQYHRALTGIKADYHGDHFNVTTFAAQTGAGMVHDEIALDGTSGVYHLSQHAIAIGSDKLVLQVRESSLAQTVLQSRSLVRFVDYRIDYSTGDVTLNNIAMPALGSQLILVADYETTDASKEALVAGVRVAKKFQFPSAILANPSEVGVNATVDQTPGNKGILAGIDARLNLTEHTVATAEIASSKRDFISSSATANTTVDTPASTEIAKAWLAEIAHQEKKYDVRLYANQTDAYFGLGSVSASQTGTSQLGLDTLYRLPNKYQISAGIDQTNRDATSTNGKTENGTAYARIEGPVYLGNFLKNRFDTRFEIGAKQAQQTTDVEGDLSATFITTGLRLAKQDASWDVSVLSQQAVGGEDGLSATPERLMFNANYKLSPTIALGATQEMLHTSKASATLSSAGIKYTPSAGGVFFANVGQGDKGDGKKIPMQHLGFNYRYPLNDRWSFDGGYTHQQWQGASSLLESNVGSANLPSGYLDNYNSYTLGSNYQYQDWTMQTKLELRDGEDLDKNQWGAVLYRRLADGIAVSLGATMIDTSDAFSEQISQNVRLAWSSRFDGSDLMAGALKSNYKQHANDYEDNSAWVLLHRLDWIENKTTSDTLHDDNKKLVSNFHANKRWRNDNELSLHYGAKYVWQTNIDGEYSGLTQFASGEYRYDVNQYIDLGTNVFTGINSDINSLGYGASVGFKFNKNIWLSVGYNWLGLNSGLYDDADFVAKGYFARLRLRFDQDTFHLNQHSSMP